jgi:hypothetical protein
MRGYIMRKRLIPSIVASGIILSTLICYAQQEVLITQDGEAIIMHRYGSQNSHIATSVIPAPRHGLQNSIAEGIQRGIIESDRRRHEKELLEMQHEHEIRMLKQQIKLLERELELYDEENAYKTKGE